MKSYSGVPLSPGDMARPIVHKGLGPFSWSPEPVCIVGEVNGRALISDRPGGPPRQDKDGELITVNPHQLHRLN